ncbi:MULTISPECIES: sugar porter family MFS transporter [Acidobacteriaceae]|uniref:sugar porter family MFS transporter n=1 Tax=Acidobacteriaceae TaxID=204434 RepID=UPI00131B05FC|nr:MULTISPECIES: sugar porter family MFS transporter [Acidobacteriaceae]MDW5266390.1 sugar porter family MFS transporter [Edaphobacter sp.]
MTINSHVIKSTMVGALGGLLFGFDTAVISGTTHALTQVYHLSPALLGVTVSSALVGTVIGAMAAGIPGQRFGRRDSLRAMAVFYIISALGCAFAWSWPALIFFRFIGGVGIGGSSVLGPMYIAEIAPTEWRGRLVGFFQVNIVVGILLAYVSNFLIGMMHLGAHEWRWQLGISGLPAVLFLVALFGIPRSPRWLAMQMKLEEALNVLRLTGIPNPKEDLDEIVASIHLERSVSADPLFSKRYRLPVFLAITVGMFCQLSGINAILYYLNDIFALAGASKVSGDLQAVAVGAANLVATLLAMSVIDKIGRKKLLLFGTAGLALCLSAVSYVFLTHKHLDWLVWLLMIYIAFFAVSQGAVVWVYISEVFPTRVRSKGQSLGSSSHWVTNAAISLVFPLMAVSSGAYPFIFFAAMMVLDFFLVLFYYPETSNISLEHLQTSLGID